MGDFHRNIFQLLENLFQPGFLYVGNADFAVIQGPKGKMEAVDVTDNRIFQLERQEVTQVFLFFLVVFEFAGNHLGAGHNQPGLVGTDPQARLQSLQISAACCIGERAPAGIEPAPAIGIRCAIDIEHKLI